MARDPGAAPPHVLHEDNHVLGVFKPAGWLVQGDRTGDPNLLDWARANLKARHGKPGGVFVGLVHRLDRPVAGVVLLARTSKAAARLSRSFRERQVTKTYWAVVEGRVAGDAGTLIDGLVPGGAGASSTVTAAEAAGSRLARLTYRTLDRTPDATWLEVDLETGRKHQIRAQLAALGHPVLGDVRYGAAALAVRGRIALLARAIDVPHPTRPERLRVEAPEPPDWPWPPPPARASSARRRPAAGPERRPSRPPR